MATLPAEFWGTPGESPGDERILAVTLHERTDQGDSRESPHRSWRQRFLWAVPVLWTLWILAVGCIYLARGSLRQGIVLVSSGIFFAGAWLLRGRVTAVTNEHANRRRMPSLLPGDRSLFTYDEPAPRSSPREFAEFTAFATALGVGVGLLGVNVLVFQSGDNLKDLAGWVLILGSVGWLVLIAGGAVKHVRTRPARPPD
jgi:hypothetical protein